MACVSIAGPYLTPGLAYRLEKYFVPELSIVSPAFFLFPSSLCFPSGLKFLPSIVLTYLVFFNISVEILLLPS